MKNIRLSTITFLTIGIIVACSEPAGYDIASPVELQVSLQQLSRAGYGNSWNGGESVGCCIGGKSKEYQIASDGATLQPKDSQNTFYWKEKEYEVQAYYPYSPDLPSNLTIESSQNILGNLIKSDFLYASGKVEFKGNRSLKFNHLCCKVIFTLISGDGHPSLSDASVTINGQGLSSSLSDGILAELSAGDKDIHCYNDGGNYEAIVFPQSLSTQSVTVSVNSATYTVVINNGGNWESGHQYHYEVTLNNKEITLTMSSSDGIPWEPT